MKKLMWVLVMVGVGVGLAMLVNSKRGAGQTSSNGESGVRGVMAKRPRLSGAGVGEGVDEALAGAAGEVAPSTR